MPRKITVTPSAVTSYKDDGVTVYANKDAASLAADHPYAFSYNNSLLTVIGASFDAKSTKMSIIYNDGTSTTLENPTVTQGTNIMLIDDGVITSGYEDAFVSVEVGTTSLPPSTSDNRTWAYRYTSNMDGTCYVTGNGQATGAMVSGNDRAIYIMRNGVQIAAAGSSTSTNNVASANTAIAPGDLIQYDIWDVYWRYSAGGVAAIDCQIWVATYA